MRHVKIYNIIIVIKKYQIIVTNNVKPVNCAYTWCTSMVLGFYGHFSIGEN